MSMSYRPRLEHNIVVLGAGGVGKSCLTARFVQDVWIESYDPTIEDSYRKHVNVDGKPMTLEILDTAGTEQFTAMRELYMKQGQGFLLVYSITSRNSFLELAELRETIIRIKDDDDVPIVMVGNKNDMPREDREVTRMDAVQVAECWGQKPFYEVSAKRDAIKSIEEPFFTLCRQILARDQQLTYDRHQYGTSAAPRSVTAFYHQRHQHHPSQNRYDHPYRPRRRRHHRCVIL